MTDPVIDPSDARGVADRVAAAKLWVISEAEPGRGAGPRGLPYLATALYALVLVPSQAAPALAADEQWRLYANPAWVLGASTPEVGAQLVHLTWHLLLDHADRGRDVGVDSASASPWSRAADLTILHTTEPDDIVADEVVAAARAAASVPAVDRLGDGRSAEEYFAVLGRLEVSPADGPGRDVDLTADLPACGSACDGVRREHELPPDSDLGGLDPSDAREIRAKVAIDYQGHVTGRGTEPLEAQRWARSITDPEVPWEPLLARAVRHGVGWASGRTDYTWTRPSRRQGSARGVLMPGMRRPVPSIAAVVDTSGSVDDTLLGKAMGEVEGALRALGVPGASLAVYACDAAVGAVSRVRRAADAKLTGGGGTDLRVGIASAAAGRPRPDLMVVLTDGFTPWPDTPPPGVAVIAALLARQGDPLPPTPTWATRVECVLR